MAEIRLSGINKVYPGGTHAVHDVDLHIADGEFMIMVGPSGCAKSTILRMIAGLETPTTGTVEIGGRVVNDVAPKDRDIAMVFQSYALYPHMTVRENMAFGLRLRRMPPAEIDQRVADAARILGLEQLLDRLPKAMSGGQRQRVAMGRAIVREPQAFLMDEPLSNLDAKLRVQMRTEIAKLHQRLSTTTVYVTHDQVEAMTLGQRICILRRGIVQQVDTPFQVYTNPANVFVGGFIGSPGMNFMNGHLVLHEGMLFLQLGDQHLPLPASVSSRLLATTDLHGRGVIVGVRPEHLSMSTPSDPGAIPVNVELTEAMGAEVYAYFTASIATPDLTALSDTQATAATFVARLGAGTETRSGEQIMLRPDLDEVHLFDPATMQTLLAPADECEVRARQTGAAIELAGGVATRPAGPVASPNTTIVQPLQSRQQILHMPIHLHQTIVQPDTVTVGTLADGVGTPAIAAVFDQPVASPLELQPLVAVGSGGHPRPTFADQAGGGSSLDQGFGSIARTRPASGSPSMPAPASARATSDAEEPTSIGLPLHEAPVVAVASPAPTAETIEPPTTARRGFAPRVIGAPQQPSPQAPSVESVGVGVESTQTPTVRLDGAEVDAALKSLDRPETAPRPTPGPLFPALGDSSTTQRSAFRDALDRVRSGVPSQPIMPPASPSRGAVGPPAPIVVRPPSLGVPASESEEN